jgi:hypothetical protein
MPAYTPSRYTYTASTPPTGPPTAGAAAATRVALVLALLLAAPLPLVCTAVFIVTVVCTCR